MKRLPLALATPATIFLALTLTACGDDVTKVTETGASVTAVESEANLPDCGSDNNGSFVIAQDKQKVFVCYSESWFTLNGNDGSPAQSTTADSAATGKKGADGKNGTNGTNGANGTSCTGVAFESGDSTGFKIVCGKDTLGVILNGRDGIDGKNGRHGLVPGLASKLAKRMKRGINTDFFDNLSNFTGFNDDGLVDKGYPIWDGIKKVQYPNELKKTHFKTIADAGFDHVRIQVRWNHFTGDSAKCQIDPEYMKQIKWAVDNTIANGMIAVVDEHYYAFRQTAIPPYHPSNGNTYAQISPCLKSIYKQIADSMFTYSTDSLIIELPNEPNFDDMITAVQWTNLADSLIQIIHIVDPARVIIVGSRGYYDWKYLNELNSVINKHSTDGLLMASFHYYDPTPFTGSNGPGTWEDSKANRFAIYEAFSNIASWATSNNIPIYLGEFGVNNEVIDTDAVEKWLTAIVSAADYYGFAMAIHDFSGFYFTYQLNDKKWIDYKIRPLFNPKYDMTLNPNDYDLTKLTATPIENFDGSYPSNAYFSNSWFTYSENVTTLAATIMTDCGNDRKCFHGKFTVAGPGENKYPTFSLGINVPLDKENWSYIKAISFYAKGSGLLKVAIPTNGTLLLRGDYPNKGWIGEFASEVVLTDEWKQYVIWSDGLVPEKFSWLDSLGGKWSEFNREVTQFNFWRGSNLNPESNTTVEWFIDDIVFYK